VFDFVRALIWIERQTGKNSSDASVIIIIIITQIQSLVSIRIRISLGKPSQQRSVKCTYDKEPQKDQK
jgi:hypothetical protein